MYITELENIVTEIFILIRINRDLETCGAIKGIQHLQHWNPRHKSDFVASITVRNRCLLSKPPNL